MDITQPGQTPNTENTLESGTAPDVQELVNIENQAEDMLEKAYREKYLNQS